MARRAGLVTGLLLLSMQFCWTDASDYATFKSIVDFEF